MARHYENDTTGLQGTIDRLREDNHRLQELTALVYQYFVHVSATETDVLKLLRDLVTTRPLHCSMELNHKLVSGLPWHLLEDEAEAKERAEAEAET